MKKRLGIYPGSFNPFHKGHLDILLKAEQIFDEVIVAIGTNPLKKDSTIDRVETIKLQVPGKQVERFEGYLTNYVYKKESEDYNVTVVRGLRNGVDLDYEVTQMRVLQDLKSDIKTVFIVCDKQFEHISSSVVRAMETIQVGSGSEYLAKTPLLNESELLLKGYDLRAILVRAASIIAHPNTHGYLNEVVFGVKGLRDCYEKVKNGDSTYFKKLRHYLFHEDVIKKIK